MDPQREPRQPEANGRFEREAAAKQRASEPKPADQDGAATRRAQGATSAPAADSRPELRGWPWGQRALARIDEATALLHHAIEPLEPPKFAREVEAAESCLQHARQAIVRGAGRPRAAAIAAMQGHLHMASVLTLQIMGLDRLQGRLPDLYALVEEHLPPQDPRRVAFSALMKQQRGNGATSLQTSHRELVISTVQAAYIQEEREFDRLRKFRFLVYWSAAALTILALGLALLMSIKEDLIPLCFAATNQIVCPTDFSAATSTANGAPPAKAAIEPLTSKWDYALVELVGLLGASLTLSFTLTRLRGARGPYDMVLPLALLKLPAGALTAVLGLILVAGGFVPGLSALDSSKQIIAWAAIFGSAQQLFTRLVDSYGASILDDFHGVDNPRLPPPPPRPNAPGG